jgi:hypothetical protein
MHLHLILLQPYDSHHYPEIHFGVELELLQEQIHNQSKLLPIEGFLPVI